MSLPKKKVNNSWRINNLRGYVYGSNLVIFGINARSEED